MARTSKIVDSLGRESRLRSARIAEFERAGRGRWEGTGDDRAFVFFPMADASICKPRNSPDVGRIVSRLVDDFSGSDSGFSTAAYPPASQSTGAAYPALARQGAGL